MTGERSARDRSFRESTVIARGAVRPTRGTPRRPVGYTCCGPGPGDGAGS